MSLYRSKMLVLEHLNLCNVFVGYVLETMTVADGFTSASSVTALPN
jgi:hypothetical protein